VLKRVGTYALNARPLPSGCEPFLNISYTLAIDVQHITQVSTALSGPPEVRQEARRNRHLASLLLGALTARNLEVNQSRVQVYLWPAQRQNCLLTPARVEPEQNE
jgi:hypothetical protein